MTISSQEALALVEEPSPVPREAAQRVLDYLIFHRSLLGERDGTPALLERYLGLVRNLKEGVHIVIPDPFQKATAMLFELVMDEEFDPWEIDLVRFTQLYLERVQGTEEVDFAVAGRLVYMAWSILFLQSEGILKLRQPPPEAPTDGLGPDAPMDDGYLGALESPEQLDVTTAVLGAPDGPPLTPMIRHSETRPVSLLELVSAFGEAEEQARRTLKIQALRERLREEQRTTPEVLVHGDIPERDLADTWAVARAHPVGEAFPFLSLWKTHQGREHLVSLFLASLFLVKERALELRQEHLGESPLELVRLTEERPRAPEP
jgi:segregation and condensation protein A